jgi:hypothetical protein
MRAPWFVHVAALVAAAGLSAFGCAPKKVLQPNLPPKTQLFVHYDPTDGVPHVVPHVAHLYWFGSDPDGFVAGYDIRFIWPGGPTNPAWIRTTLTDSLFVIPDTTGLVNPVFEVRAVDDQGLVDPVPPRQEFSFANTAPIVTLLDPPLASEVTIGTQTLDWKGIDPDGDANQLKYYVWLDGNEANPHVVTGNEFTFPTSDFLQGGKLRSGPRTAYVKGVDPGGRSSPVLSVTWQVSAPAPDTLQRPRLLLIDDVPPTDNNNAIYDDYYNRAITRSGIPAGSWNVLRLDAGRPFRSSKDLEQTLRLFDAVAWYRGQVPFPNFDQTARDRDTLLLLHSDALGAYLDAGGKLYIEALEMVASGSTQGLLSEAFMIRYLSADRLYKNKAGTAPDSSATWSIPISPILHSTFFLDSLRSTRIVAGLRAFAVRDTNDVVLWARDSTLTPTQSFDAPVAIKAPTAAGGEVVATSVPIARMNGFAGSTDRFIDKIFLFLGIKP